MFERATLPGSEYISTRPHGGEIAVPLSGVFTRPQGAWPTVVAMDTVLLSLPLPQESLKDTKCIAVLVFVFSYSNSGVTPS